MHQAALPGQIKSITTRLGSTRLCPGAKCEKKK